MSYKYPGNKNFSGVTHEIINRLPKSERYFSLFFGAGGIEQCDFTSEAYFICSEKNPDNQKYVNPLYSSIEYLDYRNLIEDFNFMISDFIFSDPPYLFSTRTSGRKYYKFEFDKAAHIEFLILIRDIPARQMITHPICSLYERYLKGWFKFPITYQTHAGIYNDCIWTNYEPADIELLNYQCLGKDFTDRQRIKRQRANIVRKIKDLPFHSRMAVIEELKSIIT